MIAPRATYRIQLNKDFTFTAATEIVDQLAALGISHLYVSPFLKARAGSLHGYDIIDHETLNPEIGGETELVALSDKLASQGMGLILDIVPNHMGVGGSDNGWWLDVLEWGETSPYADWFDIDWEARRADLRGKVLLPVLGDQYGIVLERGEIALRFDPAQGSFSAWYFDHRFPIAPRRYPDILRQAETDAELRTLAQDFAKLGDGSSAEARGRTHEQGTRLKAALAGLVARRPETASRLEAAAARFTGTADDPASWRPLHALLDRQAYRLAYWRAAADEINYRRFFNINDLAGIRIEEPELFARAHHRILQLVADKRLSGLRVDHIDGLFDPRDYCQRLQREVSAAAGVAEGDYYIVVEKILAAHESLRDWPIAGTTGYDFTNEVLGLFIDPAGERPLGRVYRRFTGRPAAFAEVLDQSKRRITDVNLASEMNVLARAFHALAMSNWRSRDFTLNGMRHALDEVVAPFPVYRTYVTDEGASAEDRRYIDWAVGQARRRWPGADTSILDFVHSVLTGDLARRGGGYNRAAVLRVAMKFQQLTGPAMAKGAEDTAFYRYLRLIALNEVGGDPSRFGVSVAAFHRLCEARAKRFPAAMLASATHDTKRGEDARVRLALLSEMPRQWEGRVQRWARLNRLRRGEVDGAPAPDRNDEYFFYQTLVGAWPPDLVPDDVAGVADFAARVGAAMVKMGREAKERSSWSNPNADYEAMLARFVAGALDAARPNPFLRDVHAYVETLARPGAINGLAQTLLKLTAPGVPDTFQGGELWDFSMVDPDNRRPVDWALRRRLLHELRQHPADRPLDHAAFAAWTAEWRDGREKLFLIWRALALRAAEPALFATGNYLPLATSGRHAERLCAFARILDGRAIVTVAPRLAAGAAPEGASIDWADTAVTLPPGERWRCMLTGRDVSASERQVSATDLLAGFPVALIRNS